MSKSVTLLTFTLSSIILLAVSISTLIALAHKKSSNSILGNLPGSKQVAYAALPIIRNFAHIDIQEKDARIEMVRQFFARYDSPLEPFAKDVVVTADKYGLDFRLIPAIAMQESTLCKKAPKDSYNCWGYGIYGKKVTRFKNYPEAINTVTKTLAVQYKKDGLHTPEEIMSRYTPSSNGSWAEGVNFVMSRLQ